MGGEKKRAIKKDGKGRDVVGGVIRRGKFILGEKRKTEKNEKISPGDARAQARFCVWLGRVCGGGGVLSVGFGGGVFVAPWGRAGKSKKVTGKEGRAGVGGGGGGGWGDTPECLDFRRLVCLRGWFLSPGVASRAIWIGRSIRRPLEGSPGTVLVL